MDDLPADNTSGLIFSILGVAAAIALLVSFWKVFVKAGHPGWASLIPIYNAYVMLKIAEMPMPILCLLGLYVPFVNVVIAIVMSFRIANAFGKGFAFGLGLTVLPFIFYPILAFDDDTQCRGVGRSPKWAQG